MKTFFSEKERRKGEERGGRRERGGVEINKEPDFQLKVFRELSAFITLWL